MSAISIIIPVFNVERYLDACLDSLLAQTFSDWEAILVDDGSTDASGRICDEYAEKDARFRVLHQKNRGVSAARNAGMDIAEGAYWMFVDGDDTIDPPFLEIAFRDAGTYAADIVCMPLLYMLEDGTPFPRSDFAVKVYRGGAMAYSAIFDRLVTYGVIPKLFRRGLFEGIRFPQTLCNAEDTFIACDLFARAACVVRSAGVSGYRYRRRAGSASRSARPAVLNWALLGEEKMIARTSEAYPELLDAAYARYYRTVLGNLDAIFLSGPRFRRHPGWRHHRRLLLGGIGFILRAHSPRLGRRAKLFALVSLVCPSLAARLSRRRTAGFAAP